MSVNLHKITTHLPVIYHFIVCGCPCVSKKVARVLAINIPSLTSEDINKQHANSHIKDPKKKRKLNKSIKKELRTIIDSGTLNIKEQAKPNDVVYSSVESDTMKMETLISSKFKSM
jgi:hypothetical protein